MRKQWELSKGTSPSRMFLKQQIEKKEYYAGDGGSGGKRPGGGGGDGEGFGEPGDESPSGMLEEFTQVILATLGFVFLVLFSFLTIKKLKHG